MMEGVNLCMLTYVGFSEIVVLINITATFLSMIIAIFGKFKMMILIGA